MFFKPGLVSKVLMKKKEMEIVAKLKNIVILDCDKDALYKKVQTSSSELFAGSVYLCVLYS